MNRCRAPACLLALMLMAALPAADAARLSWGDVAAREQPPPLPLVRYGPAPAQFGELRLPDGAGPFPVVVLIHGGCWLAEYDYSYFRHFAARFAAAGYASWTIEYRRVGDAGGGWPGTFRDVATAIDALPKLATEAPLDLDRVITAGHSAGGQLALWALTRDRLPADSPLAAPAPFVPRGAIGLAAITDLADYSIGPPDSCHAAVEPLMGGRPDARPERYRQASPAERLPLDRPAVLIQGEGDRIVPLSGVERDLARARRAGDDVTLITLPGAGHFDTAVPTAANWPAIAQAAARLTGRAR